MTKALTNSDKGRFASLTQDQPPRGGEKRADVPLTGDEHREPRTMPEGPSDGLEPAPGGSTRSFLRSLASLVLAVCVTIGLLVGLSELFCPQGSLEALCHYDREANGILGEREGSIDVLFLGDSESYSSFSPLDMWGMQGFTSYNCASHAQKLCYTNTLLKRATSRQNPRVVIFETNCLFRKFSLSTSLLRQAGDVLPVFEYHNLWKDLVKTDEGSGKDAEGKPASSYVDPYKGFRLRKKAVAADDTAYMEPDETLERIPRLNRLYLHRMFDYCESIGAVPVLVSTPSTVNWNYKRHNAVARLAAETGVAYLDLNEGETKVDIDWHAETIDAGDHVNYAGAVKVSSFLADYLAQTYDLPDHRNDAAYADWASSYEWYLSQL